MDMRTREKIFKSGDIPYNPLNIYVTKMLVNQTKDIKLIQKNDMWIFFTDFFHNKKCEGILYESELDDNIIIIYDKCKGINYIDKFF